MREGTKARIREGQEGGDEEGERIAACVGMDQCVNDGCLTRTAKLLLVE